MGQIVDIKKENIKTSDGQVLVRRVTTVLRDNGRFRYPVDYYDPTPGAVKVSEKEKDSLRVPGYKELI